ncbi:lysophospholipid acyltransferase family protein [Actinoplanes sp. RD1]|uniref:lysophospholipid acyltransferase family protein n=1 Tax=Actinoplanes sp. RD1 TaxID=3064538 RepID=UPI002741BB7D|nr:lysophospholipid acyltransferase family protein [Actinoplanes sp. RD1]
MNPATAMMWRPESGCGPHCVPGGDDTASPLVQAARIGAAAAVLLAGLVIVPLARGAAVRWVARTLLTVLGVRLVRRGPAPRPGSLLAANHVSWIDVLALLTATPLSLVAKREVGGWPGVGAMARALGVIFIDRTRPMLLPATVAEVAATLRTGRTVAVFPEGTTSCGARPGRFRPAMFQAAVDAAAPVVPVTIRYGTPAASFVGHETLWQSVRRVAALRELTVTVVAAPALRPEPGASRRSLARAAQASSGLPAARFGLAA